MGMRFSFASGTHGKTKSIRVFESTGGGTAVIDFDMDGDPDVFFTQGEPWPLGSEVPQPSSEQVDVLYRNNKMQFQDVTLHGIPGADDGYGQGCSSADFDNGGREPAQSRRGA